MYFVQINCRESFNTLLGASIQTLHVHAVDLSKLHILGLLHEELHDNLIEHILEANAVGTPGSKELDDHNFVFINKLLKCEVIESDGSDTVGRYLVNV